MGRGIAERCLRLGIPVVLRGRSDASLATARDAIFSSLKMAARRKLIEPEIAENATGLLRCVTDFSDLADCGLIIETVAEDLALKRELLQSLDRATPPETVIGTNTSSFAIAELGEHLVGVSRLIGFHFMNPAASVDFAEIIPGRASEETVAVALAWCERLSLQHIICPDRRGFVVNRLLMALLNEAARLAAEGEVKSVDIDNALRLGCGLPTGPLALIDLIGVDTVTEELANFAEAYGDRFAPAEIFQTLLAQNRLGRKTGKGISQYKF
jgi:3-hydroxybutyryl-CoA dehydrogenase